MEPARSDITPKSNLSGLASWSVDDIFSKLQRMSREKPYLRSDLIVDWISRARPRPTQNAVHQVLSEIQVEHLNEVYLTFLSDVVRQKGYVTDRLADTPRNAVYYNASMENIRKSKLNHLESTKRHDFSPNTDGIKCPAELCPDYRKLTMLSFKLQPGETCSMSHPASKIEHAIDHWYCGLITNSKWSYLSLINNSSHRICEEMEAADEVWVGYLIKRKGILEVRDNWKLYSFERLVALERKHLPDHVWMEIFAGWIQHVKPDKATVKQIWASIDINHLEARYVQKILRCLADSGYKNLTPESANQKKLVDDNGLPASFKTIWIKLSRGQKHTLLNNGHVQLFCKCPMSECLAASSGKEKVCTAVLQLSRDAFPCFSTPGFLVHPNSYQHPISHWYCVTKHLLGRKRRFISFYAYSTPEFLEVVRASGTVWVGIGVSRQ